MKLENAVCIVTGSATGVGAAVARRLAARHARVVINYTRSEEQARATEDACRALGADTLRVRADIGVDADCRRMAAEVLDRWGRIDALVNNAATTEHADPFDLESLSPEAFSRVLGVNVVGTWQMTRAVVPAMRQAGAGAVVNVSSAVTQTGGGSSIAYTASKGAVNALTLAMARVLAPEIRVNAVCPGLIDTRWMPSAIGAERWQSLIERAGKSVAMGRIAQPDDVADPIVWLLEGTDFITGELLMVDGGARLGGPPRTPPG